MEKEKSCSSVQMLIYIFKMMVGTEFCFNRNNPLKSGKFQNNKTKKAHKEKFRKIICKC